MRGFEEPIELDLIRSGLISADFCERAVSAAHAGARFVVMDGKPPPGTLEVADSPISYWIADGDCVNALMPELVDLYREGIPALLRELYDLVVLPSATTRSGVTLNMLRNGQRYELHVDENPLTAVLYVRTIDEAGGGVLRLFSADGTHTVRPRAGVLVLFEGQQLPHDVTAVGVDSGDRISAPMNYYFHESEDVRDPTMDCYLFGGDGGDQ